MRIIWPVVAAFVVASCSQGQAVRDQIAANFRDPNAVQFKQFHIAGHRACGFLNAKNAFGAYVGYKPFVTTFDDPRQAITPDFGPRRPIMPSEWPSTLQSDKAACDYQRAHAGQGFSGCSLEPHDRSDYEQSLKFLRDFEACQGKPSNITLDDDNPYIP